MANTPQAKKRILRNAKRAEINRARVSRIRTFVKQVESALAAGDKDEAKAALARVQPELSRGVARGVLHKNTASRKLSRLTRASRDARLSAFQHRQMRPAGPRRRAFSCAANGIAKSLGFPAIRAMLQCGNDA